MNIKKIILLFTTIMGLCLGLSSCSSYRAVLARDDEKYGEARFQNIIDALENKDKEGIKKMFSSNALKEAKDIDGGIEYLMKFYKGKLVSKEGAYNASHSKGDGEKTITMKYFYMVTTDEDKFIVFFIDKVYDKKNPDNVGLYMLQIIKLSDREKEFDWGGDKTRCAGIYRPEDNKK
ncbi:DUF5104 domain-containing protein [Ruminiclostridium josui]|uniref:DUF5104 domain-containing protein n=1 Tax=Ruminiclostridium josui TaxID=1499 RepID=UPI000463934C|nr:DUF5104 domain-containing protein [Ruminiclostridium josui]